MLELICVCTDVSSESHMPLVLTLDDWSYLFPSNNCYFAIGKVSNLHSNGETKRIVCFTKFDSLPF